MVNKDLIAPCGLYCGVCGIYYASVKNELKLFSCDECGDQLFRGAKKCRACGSIKEQRVC